MKTSQVASLAVLVAAIALVAWLARGSERRGAALAPATDTTPPSEADAAVESVEPVARVPIPAPREPVAADTEPVQPPEDPAWFACHDEPGPEAFRACLERTLPAGGLDAPELARWLCSGEWWTRFPESDPLILAEVAIPRWPRASFFPNLEYVLGRCSSEANLDRWWAAFLRQKLAGDPAWAHSLADALDPATLFDDTSGLLALETALTLCEPLDCPQLDGWLEDGARGHLGGSDEQVARAMEAAWRRREGAAARLALLESVASSPEFRGRDFETDALIGLVLHAGSVPGGDPGPPVALARRILDDPALGPGAAEHLTVLADWDSWPAAYTAADREELLARAARLLDLPAANR